ncbi:ABC transporter substrate-binding protein [Aureimonas fodinaquatilis]|uniref:ABC transporter substrate-binding protein n=1 Tax=Aureimonas fodinaquatilis TaxID=2565783 RepID=A0A5B0DZ88_9HYPH|nr:ABC transporter substrate-binding protein [Aureimonas fodinaquatilis]KAA0971853.1 ABC transporter substrate-binding protein [Aureimonas fodinaquatilis]
MNYLTRHAVLAFSIPLFISGAMGFAHAQNDSIVVGLSGDPTIINSGITTEISSSVVGAQIYSTIVRLDSEGNPIPSLAESWEVSDDGLTYTFKFFDGIKWHDGTPFTSQDVAWSLLNINREFNGPAGGLLKAVETIETPDDRTAVFKLSTPYPPLLRGLAYFNSSTILPRHIFDNGQDPRENPANLKPIGTGPFVFSEFRPGSHITLQRNEDYHLDGPHVERLIYQIIPNEAARGLALETGEIDYIPYHVMPLGEVDRLQNARDITVAFQKRSIAGQYQAFLNTREGPLAEKAVRQALYHAMNRDELLEKAGFGHGTVSKGGPLSSELPIFYTDDVKQYPYDPELANKMLDEAGFERGADGKRFTLRISYALSEGPMQNVAQLLRSNFAAVGVDLVDQGMETSAWRDRSFVQWDFDITMGSYASGPDPAIGAAAFYTCDRIQRISGHNASAYCNEEVDALFSQGSQELNEDRRIEIYHEAAAQVTEDVPHWWFWDRYYPIAFRANLEGITEDITGYGTMDGVRWVE